MPEQNRIPFSSCSSDGYPVKRMMAASVKGLLTTRVCIERYIPFCCARRNQQEGEIRNLCAVPIMQYSDSSDSFNTVDPFYAYAERICLYFYTVHSKIRDFAGVVKRQFNFWAVNL